jgi:hypothetical protein
MLFRFSAALFFRSLADLEMFSLQGESGFFAVRTSLFSACSVASWFLNG